MRVCYDSHLPALSLQDGESTRSILVGTVLPTLHGAVLCKNWHLCGSCWEDRPHQDRASALPVPKGQGRQVRVVTDTHPCIPPCRRGFSFIGSGAAATASVAAAASAAAAAAAAATATSPAGPGDKVSQSRREDRPDVSAPL